MQVRQRYVIILEKIRKTGRSACAGKESTMQLYEETTASELLYKGRILELYRDDVRLENGEPASREWVHHSGGVSILALNETEEVYIKL